MMTRRALLGVFSALAVLPLPAGAVRPPDSLEMSLPPRVLARDVPAPIPGVVRERGVPSFDLSGAPRDVDDVVHALRRWIAAHRRRFGGLGPHDLVAGYRLATPAADGLPGSVYVEFTQRHEGLAVEGSRVAFVVRLLPGRSVVAITDAAVYPSLDLPAPAAGEPRVFRQGGARALGLRGGDGTLRHEGRKIRFVEGRWRRVREMAFAGEPLGAVVDEDSGESWAEDRRLYVDVGGRAHGRGKPGDPAVTTWDDFLLKDLLITIPRTGSTTYTNASGDFLFTGRPQNETIEARLTGRWIDVRSIIDGDNRVDIVVTKTGATGLNVGFNINTDGPDPCVIEADTAQVNAYALGTKMHDWIRSYVPGGVPGIDCPLRAEVNAVGDISWYQDYDHDGVCDDQTVIHLGEGGICDAEQPAHPPFRNTAYDTIIFHEYGHFVDDMAGGIQDLGLSEGWGDLLATYVSGQPLIGESIGVRFGYAECDTECIRRADNHYQFNPNDGQHIRGMAWSGFGW